MSDELNVLKSELAELKASLKNSEAARAELADKLAKADVAKYETQIADLTAKVEAAAKKDEENKKAADQAKADLEAISAKLAEVEKAKAELETNLAKAEAEKARASRIAVLTEGGVEKAEAEKKVDLFANLNDEQFTSIASELVEAAKAKRGDKEDDKKNKKGDKAAAAEAAVEGAKPVEEVVPVVASENDSEKTAETRKALASLLIKNKK